MMQPPRPISVDMKGVRSITRGPFDLPRDIVDRATWKRAAAHLRAAGVRLPKFAELAEAPTALAEVAPRLKTVDPNAPDPLNLFRVHWFNDASGGNTSPTPGYLRLPAALTGVEADIVVLLGERFPMIGSHKVIAAYGCLIPRLVAGGFDPERDRAVWPSTGNYCRGGIAISRILGCRGVAVLPEGMSAERFRWLESWVTSPADIVRTPGTESNVKEIYDECQRLAQAPENVILNQFSEFANYAIHRLATGRATECVFEALSAERPRARLAAFVAATGSAGTIGAGDALKQRHGTRIVAVEPVECPTLLYNGYGEHNIQGIGDKHVPLIHNLMNTDLVVAVSDGDSDALNALFNTAAGQQYLVNRKGLPEALVKHLGSLGLSGIANVIGAIKTARRLALGPDDVVVTVATDSAELYASELDKWLAEHAPGGFDEVAAAEIYGAHLKAIRDDHVLELTEVDRRRIFNLGYYTWVEQQGVSLEDFDRRRSQDFWQGVADIVPVWDEMIERFNAETGLVKTA